MTTLLNTSALISHPQLRFRICENILNKREKVLIASPKIRIPDPDPKAFDVFRQVTGQEINSNHLKHYSILERSDSK